MDTKLPEECYIKGDEIIKHGRVYSSSGKNITKMIKDQAKVIVPNLSLTQVAKICMNVIRGTPDRETPRMTLPISLERTTKMNRIRLIPGDRTSPMGNVLKGEVLDCLPYASAAATFNAIEVMLWLNEQTEETQENDAQDKDETY
jgi:hypothetical protein